MMRAVFLGAVVALVIACTPQTAPNQCDLSAANTIAFTAADARDQIVAQAIGPTCDKAIGLYTIRSSDGYPIWSWSAPLAHRFGEVFAAEDTEHVQSFLDTWVQPEIITTEAAPAWEELATGQTTFDQLTYTDIRARNLPMLCHFSGTARQTCVFWEPAAGGAGLLFERDVQENQE